MNTNRMLPWRALLLALVTLAVPASAHPLRATAVLLDLREHSVEGELQLPLDQLGLTLHHNLGEDPSTLVARMGSELTRYVAEHVTATAPDGRAFELAVRSLEVRPVDGADCLVVRLSMRPPPGVATGVFTLRYDAIIHRVVTHKVFVSIRSDFKNGVFSDRPELLGVLRYRSTDLVIDRSNGTWWKGFQSVFVLGVRHIAEGTDHLLFLLVLLLAAPLVAKRGRWSASSTVSRGVKQVVKIVTAFTLGHSMTLVAGAIGILQLPSRPVEVLIALSILVSALHALRPVFSGREPLIAAGFGLVHGLAFSTVLAELGLDTQALVLSVLAFNLGIEAMQLVVVAMTMPWLLLLSRSPTYAAVRIVGAGFGAMAACGWIAERAFSIQNPIAPLVEAGSHQALAGIVLLTTLSAW